MVSSVFILGREWDSKGRPSGGWVKIESWRAIFRPWESPLVCGGIRMDVNADQISVGFERSPFGAFPTIDTK